MATQTAVSPEKASKTHATLRVEMDGRWSARDMADSFTAFQELHNVYCELLPEHAAIRASDERYVYGQHMLVEAMRYLVRSDPQANHDAIALLSEKFRTNFPMAESDHPNEEHEFTLQVLRVQYGSPGAKDLFGVGEIVAQLKELVMAAIDYHKSRSMRHPNENVQELKNEGLRLRNQEQWVKVLREMAKLSIEEPDLSELEAKAFRAWKSQQQISRLVARGKIVNARILEDGERTEKETEVLH